jgi:catechol 2,3-dioxygenase-like lactoylglutathione lyase family enzyme
MDNIPVLGIEEIAFEVKDLERSVAFYQNVIGLSLPRVAHSKPGFELDNSRSRCLRRIVLAAVSTSPFSFHTRRQSRPGAR